MEDIFAAGDRIHARRLALVLTAAAIGVPLIGLVGWLARIPLLASFGGRFIPMAPSTAICFILLAVPLLIELRPRPGPVGSRGVRLAGGLVAVYGLLVFLGWLAGLPLTPDDLLVKEMGSMGAHRLGRMSPATGALFLLAGISLAAHAQGLSAERSANLWLALAGLTSGAVLFAGAVFTLGYALGVPLLYESRTIPLALPTALSFMLLGGGLTTAVFLYNPVSGRWYRRLNDMQIGTQLRLGLGLILALVMGLGVLSWRQMDLLWLQTKTIHDHPLQVRRAIGVLEADILGMRLEFRNMLLTDDEQEKQTALQNAEVYAVDAERQFKVLYERYLGPRTDVEDAHNAFVRWLAVRKGNLELARAGKTSEAMARIKESGDIGRQRAELLGHIKRIDDFARNKGAELYRVGLAHKETMTRQLAVAVATILLLSLLVSYLLLRGIKVPLSQLTTMAEQFRQGKLEARSGFVAANEIGVLAASFNNLAATVQAQMRINERAAQLADVMLRETEARAFCREVLKSLSEHTGSQIGAVYLLNQQQTEFELFESIGLAAGGRASFSAVTPEGEFGVALATGRMQRLTDISGETRFTFATVGGEFIPREIITLPLLAGQKTIAVISLASVRGYDQDAAKLLEAALSTLTARLNGVLAFRQTQELAARLDHQNRELEAQKQALIAQSLELTQQNSELEMQKMQLDEANRLKSAFLSNMSHELRTPLNSVIALSGVLSRRLTGSIPEVEYSYLEVIERNGRHLLALINDILDLSRIEAGREEINLSRFSVPALASEIIAMLEAQAQEKHITLTNLIADDLPLVTSDPDKVRHILQNLIANAVKFTEVGAVEVSAQSIGNELRVAVRDTGIGIAADHLPRIFEEFRQADEGTARKYGGTGLGLAIARKYATLLQGDITVESQPGQGSVFTLRLPLSHALAGIDQDKAVPPTDDAGPTSARPSPAAGQGQSILLVEDNEPAVIQMTDILSGQGYRVQAVQNGKEALAHIERSLPDAVILDLMMPEIDGFEVLRQIRAAQKSARLPVLILTAKHVTREELSVLKGNNIHQLIQKGDISKSELLTAVARMVTPPPARTAPTRPRPPIRQPRPGKAVILVVEDNKDNMRTARALLQECCVLLEAGDGRQAVEQARQHQPDLILMDLALPVMDGFAALAAIRDDEALRHIPVVALTASAMKGDREKILARGFDGYLSKPIDESLLQKTLNEILYGTE